MLLSALLYTLASLVLILIAHIYYRRQRLPSNLPRLPWVPFFGSLLLLRANYDRLYDYFVELVTKDVNALTFCFWLPNRTSIFTADANAIQHVLKHKFENYEKGAIFYEIFDDLLGDGIFNRDGAKWYTLRKTASKFFTTSTLRYVRSVTAEHGGAVVRRLRDARHTGAPLDIEDLLARFTLDTFSEVALGVEVGSLQADVPFSRAFDACSALTALRGIQPLSAVLGRLLASERALARNLQTLDDFALQVIESRRAESDEARARGDSNVAAQRHDLLAFFLRGAATSSGSADASSAVNEESNTKVTADEEPHQQLQQVYDESFLRKMEACDTRFLRDQIINFLFAGRDTTASLLTWFFYEMSRQPEYYARIEAEVRQAMRAVHGDDGDGELSAATHFTYECTRKTPLLEAALLETLRLHPPVARNAKMCVKDDVWPCGTRVRRGTLIVWFSYVCGRLSRYFDEPSVWRPERWLDADKYNGGKPVSEALAVPFHYGPRVCLGRRLALMEASVLIALVVCDAKMRLELDEARYDARLPMYGVGSTMKTRIGMWMRVVEAHDG